ncbi:hypothetical protein JCM19298_2271 [Nonlabens ulvanivorans]|nr:hypothetical protein JCM19298_2271 [Nonlabens ulvanivorans]
MTVIWIDCLYHFFILKVLIIGTTIRKIYTSLTTTNTVLIRLLRTYAFAKA